MEKSTTSLNLKGSIGGRLSCVDLSHDERHDVSTTLLGQNHNLSGLNKNIFVETGDRRNEAMSLSLAAGKISTGQGQVTLQILSLLLGKSHVGYIHAFLYYLYYLYYFLYNLTITRSSYAIPSA